MEPDPRSRTGQEEETLRRQYRPDVHAEGQRFSERSPEEIRERVKESVRRGIASIAGALEGLNEEVEQDELSEKTERAVHNVGETARRMMNATREETQQTRQSMKGMMHDVGPSTPEVAGAAKEETRETKRTLQGDGRTQHRTIR